MGELEIPSVSCRSSVKLIIEILLLHSHICVSIWQYWHRYVGQWRQNKTDFIGISSNCGAERYNKPQKVGPFHLSHILGIDTSTHTKAYKRQQTPYYPYPSGLGGRKRLLRRVRVCQIICRLCSGPIANSYIIICKVVNLQIRQLTLLPRPLE